jgi:hypothetical protein
MTDLFLIFLDQIRPKWITLESNLKMIKMDQTCITWIS